MTPPILLDQACDPTSGLPSRLWRVALVFAIALGILGVAIVPPSLGDQLGPAGWIATGCAASATFLAALLLTGMMQELVRRATRERTLIARVAQMSRSLSGGEDPRGSICDASRDLCRADVALLFEPQGHGLRVTEAVGRDVPSVLLPFDLLPSPIREAWETGEPRSTVDAAPHPFSAALGIQCWVHQPVCRDGRTTAVLTLGWAHALRAVPSDVFAALSLLAAEASAAIHRAELVAQLAEMARQDPLTGLMNRRAWDDHLGREIARADRTGQPLAIAVLDLDHFKRFNDDHGHLAGDQLLKATATAWARGLRAGDVLARWGGEEFAVLMPDSEMAEAHRVLTRLMAMTPMGLTVSAGVTTTHGGASAVDLMAAADAAVYRAKATGRNRVVAASPEPSPLSPFLAALP